MNINVYIGKGLTLILKELFSYIYKVPQMEHGQRILKEKVQIKKYKAIKHILQPHELEKMKLKRLAKTAGERTARGPAARGTALHEDAAARALWSSSTASATGVRWEETRATGSPGEGRVQDAKTV